MQIGKMVEELLASLFKKPATLNYPYDKSGAVKGVRGELQFFPDKCIGCKICMKDCPSNAIIINKIAEKEFEAVIDLSKCIFCGQCVDSCPKAALAVTSAFELAVLDKAKLKVGFRGQPKTNTQSQA